MDIVIKMQNVIAEITARREPKEIAPDPVVIAALSVPVLHDLGTDDLRIALGYDNEYSPSELSSWDVEEIAKSGALAEAWYWYFTGCYCGSGAILGRDQFGAWWWDTMNHCSCNGPGESIVPGQRYASLEEIEASGSADAIKEVAPLIAAARAAAGATS